MELLPFESSIRTEWKTKNKIQVFNALLDYFTQLTPDDFTEINARLIQPNSFDYFEVPHYKKLNDQSPAMILVFQNNRTFIDILDSEDESIYLPEIKSKISQHAEFIKSRKMTSAEWEKRLKSIMHSIQEEEDLEDDFDDEAEQFADEIFELSVPCDDLGHLERSAFRIIAKQPVVDWLNDAELKSTQDPKKRITWTLEKVNSHPDIFLSPVMLELESKSEQNRVWAKLKERAFYNFVNGYFVDDSYWPEITQKKFNEWFDIEQQGCVIDITD